MQVFHVQARWTPFLIATLLIVFSTGSFIGGALPAFRGDTVNQTHSADQLQATVFTIVCTLFFFAGLTYLRGVHAIRVEDSGTITFVRAVGTTRVPACDIRQMEGHYIRDYEGNQVWQMDIRYGRWRLRIDEFPGVLEFVQRVEALNPNVTIKGLWPLVQPPVPSRENA